ncbi:MAG: hypothetical protein J6S14_15720 [Clostridia bacterium]|nr:hypothetical protein [Clostridia bacterium]
MKNNPIFQTELGKLALEIYEWCKSHHLWGDNTIYFDGHAISNCRRWGDTPADAVLSEEGRLYYYKDKNPRDYFEYVNPNGLSMSFEGELYDVLNAYTPGWTKYEDQFRKIFERHGWYYEMGHAWNLSTYKL